MIQLSRKLLIFALSVEKDWQHRARESGKFNVYGYCSARRRRRRFRREIGERTFRPFRLRKTRRLTLFVCKVKLKTTNIL